MKAPSHALPTRWLLLAALLFAFGCGDDDDVVPDGGGGVDAGEDGGVADAGEDGGVADAGEDGGVADAGEDGGVADAGEDGGVADAGEDGGTSGVHPTGWAAPDQHGTAFNTDGAGECTTCHGDMLQGAGSAVSCETCHSGFQTDCTFCHGGVDNDTGAPPESVGGEVSPTVLEVGAHTAHVEDTDVHDAFDCTSCHGATIPDSALTPGHVDGDAMAEVAFGDLNPDATYDADTGTCSNLYCHGDGQSSNGTAVWNADVTLACGDCHGAPPSTGRHQLHSSLASCDDCHSGTAASNSAIANPTLHVNGTVDVQLQTGTWDSAANSCNPACHGPESWR